MDISIYIYIYIYIYIIRPLILYSVSSDLKSAISNGSLRAGCQSHACLKTETFPVSEMLCFCIKKQHDEEKPWN
jgi:hypothetical protein